MADVRLISNSEVQAFKQCRRKWWLAWYRGLTPRKKAVQGIASTGTRLHIALDALYSGGSTVAAWTALRAAQTADRATVEAQEDNPFSSAMADLAKDFDLESAMLEGYLEWLEETGADSALEVVSTETYVEAPFLEGGRGMPPVTLIGRLDLRVRDRRSGRRAFMDHKSVQAFKAPVLLGLDEQLLHYHLLEFLNTDSADQRCDAAYYNQLRRVKRGPRSKPPYFKRETVSFNQHELLSYTQRLTGVVQDIQRVERDLREEPEIAPFVTYPTPSRDCTWKCPFLKVCRMFDDGSRVESALEEMYEVGDPLAYYQGDQEKEE